MSARAVGTLLASCALLALVACEDSNSGAKTEESSEERISAGLDACAQENNAFAQQICSNRALVGLDNQVRETLVAEAANVSDAGAEMLVRNQQRWREAQRISCGILDAETAPTPLFAETNWQVMSAARLASSSSLPANAATCRPSNW